jgi:hypothetical protein
MPGSITLTLAKPSSAQVDQFAQIKLEYEAQGLERSNLRHGYVNNPIAGSIG